MLSSGKLLVLFQAPRRGEARELCRLMEAAAGARCSRFPHLRGMIDAAVKEAVSLAVSGKRQMLMKRLSNI